MNVKSPNNSKTMPLIPIVSKVGYIFQSRWNNCRCNFSKNHKQVQKITGKKLNIYSPGIGTQGGKIKETIANGSDFLIVGRTILNSKESCKDSKTITVILHLAKIYSLLLTHF